MGSEKPDMRYFYTKKPALTDRLFTTKLTQTKLMRLLRYKSPEFRFNGSYLSIKRGFLKRKEFCQLPPEFQRIEI